MNDTYHHGNLRQNLISEGLKMLNREGVAGFSLRKLAQRLKVSHTAPYRHFSSKEELLREIVIESSQKFHQALAGAVTDEMDGEERLIQLGIGYVRFYLANPEVLSLFTLLPSDRGLLAALVGFGGGDKPGVGMKSCAANIDEYSQDEGFGLFREIAGAVAASLPHLSEREILLGYWSKVHGMATLLVTQKGFIPEEELDKTVERVMRTPF